MISSFPSLQRGKLRYRSEAEIMHTTTLERRIETYLALSTISLSGVTQERHDMHSQRRRSTPLTIAAGEHTGSPLQPMNMWNFVGADLCVCP